MTDRERVVELAKRRGFFFPAGEPYGGVAGFWTYGPAGAALKRNVEDRWRDRFVTAEGNHEIDAPTILPEPIFEASGHLEDFTDMIVDCPDCGRSHRADHLVEAAGDVEDAEGLAPETIAERIADLGISCPVCGADLGGEAVDEFNLMFTTGIGPGDGEPGYLRPETAQATLVDTPRLLEYARGRLPFGIVQVGRAYRNEISPRRSIIRVREMTQAELEFYTDPDGDGPDLDAVEGASLRLYPAADQEADGERYRTVTPAEAVTEGYVDEPWLAYFLGRTERWLCGLGVDPEQLRFRQHLSAERAHYARDCWDGEVNLGGDWIELVGLADRGQYDLEHHAAHSGEDYTIFRQYDEPRSAERATVDPDMSTLGPAYGEAAPDVVAALEERARTEPAAFEGEVVTIDLDGETHEVPVEATGFQRETITEAGEHVTPQVIEPAFGVDRLVFTLLMHAYREDEVDGEPRRYLALPPSVAPTLAGVFPLLGRDDLESRASRLHDELAGDGLAVTYDDAGNIGRRYRRQDEIGTPFCVTVDHRTLEDDTVTVRDRDSTAQIRLAADDLPTTLRELREGRLGFDALLERAETVDRELAE